ncbi:MAG TPA: DUF2188 domain-containing protein [Thermoleophilaceae bacterium]|nr:DUF2188 domain-containing protein [Thermoleophilaceae bacterium]
MATWKEIREQRVGSDPARNERIRREKVLLDLEVALADLRKRRGLSQVALADLLGTSQPNISRIEREEDVQLSTLASYITGIGGRLVAMAVFDDETVHLTGEGVPAEPALALVGGPDQNGGTMSKANDSDRYVEPNRERGGWDVKKENAERASVHTDTKKEAVDAARGIVKNQGGGEIRIANKDGDFIDSDTVRGPKHKESPARDRK